MTRPLFLLDRGKSPPLPEPWPLTAVPLDNEATKEGTSVRPEARANDHVRLSAASGVPTNASTEALRLLPRPKSPDALSRLGRKPMGHRSPATAAGGPSELRGRPPASGASLPPRWQRLKSWSDLTDLGRLPSFAEWQKLQAAVPPELIPIVGLVPSAWMSAQNTQLGLRRWRHARDVRAALPAAPSSATVTLAPAQRFAAARAWAAKRAADESSLFLLFNGIEHVSWLLSATPLALRLLRLHRLSGLLAPPIAHVMPALIAAHGLLHVARHTLALSQVARAHLRVREVLGAAGLHSAAGPSQVGELATMPPAWREGSVAGYAAQLYCDTLREQHQRMLWLGAWGAFEVGLLIGATLLSYGLPPLWASLWLGGSIVATKAFELSWGAVHEPPLATLWPGGCGPGTDVTPLHLRAFGPLAQQARAHACLAKQEQVLARLRASVLAPLPPWQRYALQAASAAVRLPFGTWLWQQACARWLAATSKDAAALLLAGHMEIWAAQAELLQAEKALACHLDQANAHALDQAREQERSQLVATLAYVAAAATPAPAARSPSEADGGWLSDEDGGSGGATSPAPLPPYATAGAVSAEAWQLMLRTWGLQATALELGDAAGEAQAIGALLLVSARELAATQSALRWGAQVSLAVAAPGPICWSHLVSREAAAAADAVASAWRAATWR